MNNDTSHKEYNKNTSYKEYNKNTSYKEYNLDNLNIITPEDLKIKEEENKDEEKPIERPRWFPKITLNKYFRQKGLIESYGDEKPETKSQINHKAKVKAERRLKNKATRRVKRIQRVRAGKKHCKLV